MLLSHLKMYRLTRLKTFWGEVQLIGATTISEYRKHIEKDAALERRFQPVIVNEPTIEDSIEILMGIKGYYEKHHGNTDHGNDHHDVFLDKNGFLLFEYFYHSEMISSIEYSTDSENRCPITVYTREAMREASALKENIKSILYLAIFA